MFIDHFTMPGFRSLDFANKGESTTRGFKQIKEFLEKENGIRKKRNIYFTPNGRYQGSDKIIKRDGFVYDYLVISRFKEDTQAIEVMKKLKPTFIVESFLLWDAYFKFKKVYMKEEIKRTYSHLSKRIPGWGEFCESNKFFLLPGFVDWNDNSGETKVKVIEENLERVIGADARVRDERRIELPGKRKLYHRTDFEKAIDNLSILDVICCLGYRIFNDKVIVDGYPERSLRIDMVGNTVINNSKFVDLPSGRPSEFLLDHFKDLKEAEEFVLNSDEFIVTE
jgi:hypothetical protein